MEIILYCIITYFSEALIIKLYCSALFTSKYSKTTEWASVFILYSILFGIYFLKSPLLNMLAFLIVNFIFIYFIYRVSWANALFHSMIANIFMCLSEMIIIGLISNFVTDFYKNDHYPAHSFVLMITSKPIYFWFLYALSHLMAKAPKKQWQNTMKELFLFAAFPCISLFITLTFAIICYCTRLPEWSNRMIAASSALLLASNLIIYGIYVYSEKRNQEFTEIQLQLQKEYDSVSYYKMFFAQREAQNILIHDIKKHLNSIALLNEQGEKEKIASYIDQIVSSSDLKTASRVCDNEFLNAILCRYINACREQGIAFHADIRSGAVDFMEENDLTSLFCNLLDNALEAAAGQSGSFIDLRVMKEPQVNVTAITMVNSCGVNPFDKTGQRLLSTKKEPLRHGFGIRSIRRIVKIYDGNMDLYYNDNEKCFHTIISLKNYNS